MKLLIHRGTHEIGGSCVELRAGNNKILIDFGMPLVDARQEPFDARILSGKSVEDLKKLKVLPNIKGLYKGAEKGVDAIFISHAHMDHYGLLQYAHPDIPIYMSQGAKQLIEISDIFTPNKIGKINTQIIAKYQKITIGDFAITPYLVDHSAFDALAFLIEAEGKRVFCSGDFRAHGRKAILFKQMVKKPPQNIDCLLMEGSALGREDVQFKAEADVEERLEEILKERKNITFLFASGQNIDRIVSAYRACLKTGSIFVVDIYTAFILDKLKQVSERIPQFNWKNIRVKFINAHAKALERAGDKERLYIYNKRKIELPEISRDRNKILMLARDNSVFPLFLNKIKDVAGAKIAYSMWDGYLTQEFKAFCKCKGLVIEYIHASGHAIPDDLKIFAGSLKPKALIPIHTFHAEKYKELFNNVKLLEDGEVLEL